jgi:hypothetical protein
MRPAGAPLGDFQRHLQVAHGPLAADAREAVEEVVQSVTTLQVVHEVLDGDAGSGEHKSTETTLGLRETISSLEI